MLSGADGLLNTDSKKKMSEWLGREPTDLGNSPPGKGEPKTELEQSYTID